MSLGKFLAKGFSGGNMTGLEAMTKRQLVGSGPASSNKMTPRLGGSLAWMGVSTAMNVSGGDDLGTGLVKAGAETALWNFAPGIMTAHLAATTIPDMVIAGHEWKRRREGEYKKNFYRGTVGGDYIDTQRAATMRQASVEAINGSKINARSILGGEARLLNQNSHRGQGVL